MNELIDLIGIISTVLAGLIFSYIGYNLKQVHYKVNNEIFSLTINKVNEIISDCVKTTNQTYVNYLKDCGSFDTASQKKALLMSFESVTSILSDYDKNVLTKHIDDLTVWITVKIESYILADKL